jgi:ABC-type glycerol-3-phosphate transport system permease component
MSTRPGGTVTPARRAARRAMSAANWALVYAFMISLVAFTALPLVYVVMTAFKPLDELFLYPPRFLVRKPTLQNFSTLLVTMSGSVVPFSRYVFNSLFTSVVVVAGSVVISSMGAYSLVKLRPPGLSWLFAAIIAALMFSPQVTTIPSYLIVNRLGMMNSYWALIVPRLAVAYNFFLMKQFCEQVPDSLLESVRVDGGGEWLVFWRIAMPLMKPAWATLIVFSFVANWNDYFTPLIFVRSQAMRTLPLALQTIGGGPAVVARSGAVAAATFVTTIPTILVFLAAQRKVMRTMAYSGIKG